MTNYDKLPEYMQDGMRRYIEDGIRPGSFMYSILCNNFTMAVMSSDRINKHNLLNYADWLNQDAPPGSWGGVDTVQQWMLLRKIDRKDSTIDNLRKELKALEDRMHG